MLQVASISISKWSFTVHVTREDFLDWLCTAWIKNITCTHCQCGELLLIYIVRQNDPSCCSYSIVCLLLGRNSYKIRASCHNIYTASGVFLSCLCVGVASVPNETLLRCHNCFICIHLWHRHNLGFKLCGFTGFQELNYFCESEVCFTQQFFSNSIIMCAFDKFVPD